MDFYRKFMSYGNISGNTAGVCYFLIRVIAKKDGPKTRFGFRFQSLFCSRTKILLFRRNILNGSIVFAILVIYIDSCFILNHNRSGRLLAIKREKDFLFLKIVKWKYFVIVYVYVLKFIITSSVFINTDKVWSLSTLS